MRTGSGETSQVIKAIEFATAQKNALGIHVINLSLGHPIYEPAATDPLVRAVERAVAAGIVVVASAGNFGYNRVVGSTGYAGITSPGNAPSAITVGALRGADTVSRADDDVAPYSSRGPSWYDGFAKPDLLAPGHGIVSNSVSSSGLYEAYPSVRAGAAHMRLNGTSMATATATGVVALMLESHRQAHLFGPAIAPNTIKAILQYTATPLDERAGATNGGATPDALTQGAGAINAPARDCRGARDRCEPADRYGLAVGDAVAVDDLRGRSVAVGRDGHVARHAARRRDARGTAPHGMGPGHVVGPAAAVVGRREHGAERGVESEHQLGREHRVGHAAGGHGRFDRWHHVHLGLRRRSVDDELGQSRNTNRRMARRSAGGIPTPIRPPCRSRSP